MPTALDVHGFAGGFTLGVVQAGWTLVGKRENRQGFGVAICEANRHLLGDGWESQVTNPDAWEPPGVEVDLVFGNPPCSAWSQMTTDKNLKGTNHPLLSCTWDFMRFAARVDPQAIVMESVSQAFTSEAGLTCMRQLADYVRDTTGYPWYVTHVLQNNASLGGASERKRYFLVLTRFPFGVERHDLHGHVATLGEAIGDLVNLPRTWDAQPYDHAEPSAWAARLRSTTGTVDGHENRDCPHKMRVEALQDPERGILWPAGRVQGWMLERWYETTGALPAAYDYVVPTSGLPVLEHLKLKNWQMGFSQVRSWWWDRPARVITGAGPQMVFNHVAGRLSTNREVARIMGFPDDWRVAGATASLPVLEAGWGKGVSVDCGRWVATWVRASLEGEPGSLRGAPFSAGTDTLIDVSADYKPVLRAQMRERGELVAAG